MSIKDSRSRFQQIFVPIFDEISLFVMGVSFVVLALIDSQLRSIVVGIITGFPSLSPGFILFTLVFTLGLGLSIFHFFSEKKKGDFEREAMLVFAVTVNVTTGWISGTEALKDLPHAMPYLLLAIFPLWNMVNAVLLFVFLRWGILNRNHICPRNKGSLVNLVTVLFAVTLTFAVGKLVLDMHWSLIYSMCVIYATSLNHLFLIPSPPAAAQDN